MTTEQLQKLKQELQNQVIILLAENRYAMARRASFNVLYNICAWEHEDALKMYDEMVEDVRKHFFPPDARALCIKYVGKRVLVEVDCRQVDGVVMEPNPKYPKYPRVAFRVSGELDVTPFTWDAIRRAVDEKEVLFG